MSSCPVLPVGNQEGRNEGEEGDDDVEQGGAGHQGGGVDSHHGTGPHLVSDNTVFS